MRTVRILLVLPGLAALAWGGVLLAEFLLPLDSGDIAIGAWLVGGPLLHDLLVAPFAAVVGYGVVRWLGPSVRKPVLVGLVLSAVLCLLAVPLLWRTYGAPPLPGLHDGNTWLGLLVSLTVVWFGVAVGITWPLLRRLLDRRRTRTASRTT